VSILVVDTNVVAYVMKGHPLALAYRRHLEGHTLAVSFMTVAELYEGAYRAGWGRTKLARLETTLRTYLVVPSSPAICRHWALIRFERRTQPISVDDAWVAATARAHGCPLVTHNAADFGGIARLRVITEPQ
jgi:tRNA(fMet)-specific endonuclease VapC